MMIRFMLLFWLALVQFAHALEPGEQLADPALEERARDISKGLRCLVCRNQSIDDSDAQLAKDLRILVRERLVAGDSNAEVRDFIVDRYGEYVLLTPPFSLRSAALYLFGPLLLVLGCYVAWRTVRRQPAGVSQAPVPLDAAERARLEALTKDEES